MLAIPPHDLDEVELALIEPNGMVSVVKRDHSGDTDAPKHPEL